jgi:mono/diheme cytochrome c family protein
MQKRKTKFTVRVMVGIIVGGIAAILALFFLIQMIPFGKNHTNPAVVAEPKWDSPQTRDLAKRACFDCHSNETVWPAYSNVAPFSWLVTIDVVDGRSVINFSDWTPIPGLDTREIGAVILEGDMPPGLYLVVHPGARLSPEEAQKLADGLTKSLLP